MSLWGRKSRRKSGADFFDGDLKAQLKLSQSEDETREVRQLKEKVEKLSLICQALWSLVQEKHDLTEEELLEKVDALKHQEGQKCPDCGRVMSRSHKKCLYCGTENRSGSIFDNL